MEAIVQGPQEDGAQDLNLVDAPWPSPASELENNNSRYLYIAVEYVKDEFKMEQTVNLTAPSDTFSDFDQHVSALDPNMSSVARYSPIYSEPPIDYNPIVIHRLVQSEATPPDLISLSAPALDPMPVLHPNDIREVVENQFEPPPNEDEVLLITDQATGISYTVKPQDFVVETNLADLNDPLLDSQLLALEENALKTELSDSNSAVNTYINQLSDSLQKSAENEQFNRLSHVYTIIDKPIQSRARASLPEAYLTINKTSNGYGVFAKKHIPKFTQFGPLTGVQRPLTHQASPSHAPDYYLKDPDGNIVRLDVLDENESNWMSFVRKAENYPEQNLVISQEAVGICFTTTKTILPKSELKVGYGCLYANSYKLEALQPLAEEWPCFECSATFSTSDELQHHLDVHDFKTSRKKPAKKRPLSKQSQVTQALKCTDCGEVFLQPPKSTLRHHLIEKHIGTKLDAIERFFSPVAHYKCQTCAAMFTSEHLLKIHTYQHVTDTSDDLNHTCPECQRKFPTQRQLVAHVNCHSFNMAAKPEVFKCNVCHKIFAMRERLRRHMLVHGSDDTKPLECKTCNKRFLNNSALAGHVKIHFAGKKIFECPICRERFDHVLKLKLHVRIHCENNLYACPSCTKVFKKYSVIRKHIRAFHCDQKHACPHCTKLFPTIDKLKMHLLRHSDHREFLCADCGKQFKRKDKLKEHCKRMHSEEDRENDAPKVQKRLRGGASVRKGQTKTEPTDFHRFIYKCHRCMTGFKRRGMLVNHLAKRHPDIPMDSVPELNLPILQTTRDYYCQHCDKVYKSSSKRKAHILKNHPGAALPMSNRNRVGGGSTGGGFEGGEGEQDPTFSQTVGSVTTSPQSCRWCHKQYASKAKLLQHQKKKHSEELAVGEVGRRMGEERGVEEGKVGVEEGEGEREEEFKMNEEMLNEALGEYESGGEPFLVTIADDGFVQGNDLSNPSHLFRLLTTSSEMVPPR